MLQKALLPAAFLATLLSSTAALASATVTGPLGDAQLVRDHQLGLSYVYYGPTGADPSAVVTVHYGFSGSLTSTATMSPTGYGNQVAFLNVPSDATGFWYQLEVGTDFVDDNGGVPYALAVRDRAVVVSKPGSQIHVEYAGPVTTTYDTYLHLGWNDWNNIGDAYMARENFSYTKAGIYYDYNYVDLDAPSWANYLDFVFEDQRNGGVWDNDDGNDWHQSLQPFVQITVSPTGGDTTYVTVFYADGEFNPPAIHYGVDGWQSPTDWNMFATTGGYSIELGVSSANDTFNCAFFGNGGQWENNYGLNWNAPLH